MKIEQSMTEAIMQAAIKVIKAAIMAVREVDDPVRNARSIHTAPRMGSPVLRMSFEWKMKKSIRHSASLSYRQRTTYDQQLKYTGN